MKWWLGNSTYLYILTYVSMFVFSLESRGAESGVTPQRTQRLQFLGLFWYQRFVCIIRGPAHGSRWPLARGGCGASEVSDSEFSVACFITLASIK